MISVELADRLGRISFVKVTVLYALLSCSLNFSNSIGKLEFQQEVPVTKLQSYAQDILPAQKGEISVLSVRILPHDTDTVGITVSGRYRAGSGDLPFDASAVSGLSFSMKTHTISLTDVRLQHAMLGGMTYQEALRGNPGDQSYTLPAHVFDGFPAYKIEPKRLRDWLCDSSRTHIIIKKNIILLTMRPSSIFAVVSSLISMLIFTLTSICIALLVWSDHPPAFATWIAGTSSSKDKLKP